MEKIFEDWSIVTDENLSDNVEFSPKDISLLLTKLGLICYGDKCRIEKLEKFIFLYGNETEIYGSDERSFIEEIDSVYIYSDINRKTNRGIIPTSIFAADLCRFNDSVKSCFFFMKIINKANDGFNIFLFRTEKGLFLGCRLYGNDIENNCTLTEPINTEIQFFRITERLFYLPDTVDFIPFYGALVEAIQFRERVLQDYDMKIYIKRGISVSYLDMLSDVEEKTHISMELERERYYSTFDIQNPEYDLSSYADVIEDLSFVKSNRTNTLEMLFEAEELALLATETERENEQIILLSEDSKTSSSIDDDILKEHLDDPELMIKMLKAQKGI